MKWKQSGDLIYDEENAVMVCALAKPGVDVIRYEPVGLHKEDWDPAMQHGRLIIAAPKMLKLLGQAKDLLDHPEQKNRKAWTLIAQIETLFQDLEEKS